LREEWIPQKFTSFIQSGGARLPLGEQISAKFANIINAYIDRKAARRILRGPRASFDESTQRIKAADPKAKGVPTKLAKKKYKLWWFTSQLYLLYDRYQRICRFFNSNKDGQGGHEWREVWTNIKTCPISGRTGRFGRFGGRASGGGKYYKMAHAAILDMQERNGSSRPAIKKWIKVNHPNVEIDKNTTKGTRARKLLNNALKRAVEKGYFIRKGEKWKIKRN
jgi:hypothetical protein